MLNLLYTEMYKLKFNKTLPVLCLALLCVAVLSVIATYLTQEEGNTQPALINGQQAAYQSPIGDTYLLLFVSILAAEIIVAEYGRGTIKNLIASGKSKRQIYIVKLMSLTVTSLILCVFCVVAYAVIFTLVFGWNDGFHFVDLFSIIRFVGLEAILLIAVAGIVTFFSILFQSPVPTIGICGGLAVLEIIIVKLLAAVPVLEHVIAYFPMALSGAIAQAEPEPGDIVNVLIVGLLVFVASSIGGYQIFKRQDVK